MRTREFHWINGLNQNFPWILTYGEYSKCEICLFSVGPHLCIGIGSQMERDAIERTVPVLVFYSSWSKSKITNCWRVRTIEYEYMCYGLCYQNIRFFRIFEKKLIFCRFLEEFITLPWLFIQWFKHGALKKYFITMQCNANV